jgi:metallo-beta-lactamase family protein
VLSHAHIDHSGYLPRLVRDGYRGKVYASNATRELCALLLPDSARLMEEEAEYRNRKGATRFRPALPLYTEQEAERALKRFTTVPFHEPQSLPGGSTLLLRRAGHILGSAIVEIEHQGTRIVFSGDLGRADPLMLAPRETVREADYVLLEATYGDRCHDERDPRPALARLVQEVTERRGVLVIPAFAVGRTQEVLFLLRRLEDDGLIPSLPVVLDSPMAIDATDVLLHHPEELDHDVRALGRCGLHPRHLKMTHTVEASKALNRMSGPAIIVSASGMAAGGRVLHHLRHRLPDPRNAVLLVGYQGEGTRGRGLLEGAATVRIFGGDVPVRAQIANIDALSAHADANELVGWLRGFARAPRAVFLIHGEDPARNALAVRIRTELGWDVRLPTLGEQVPLL